MNKRIAMILFYLSFVIFLLSCKRTTGPKFPVADLQLTLQDVSCTETWLSLQTEIAKKTENDSSGLKLNLLRDDSLIESRPFTSADTILYIDGLQPATEYVFEARIYDGGALLAASPKVAVTTLDTTSHDFTWQTFEFGGQGGSSAFYDVAVIDQNDAWAVGEIYTENDKYNAAHWDGEKWELKKIPSIICGNNSPIQSAIFTIYAFTSNDVWFSDGAELIHYNGLKFKQDCSINPLLTGKINKIWGTSDSNLYVVGNNGLIAHYDGREWARIENPTNDIGLQDASGDALSKRFWSCGYTYNGKTALIKVENKKAALLYKDDAYYLTDMHIDRLSGALTSVSYYEKMLYILTSHGLYRLFNGRLNRLKRLGYPEGRDFPAFPRIVRAKNKNDILIAGDFGMVVHYNGYSWQYYREILDRITYFNMDYCNSLFFLVGTNPNTWGGVILMGKNRD